ncbi:MAG TPA: hypothetical protein VGX23_37340 [Actinocrinis sp.]|nr:hypothetical protein [Actinocrinis sp.]
MTSQRRELPWWLRSSPIGLLALVASTRSSRRPAMALPTISSDSPWPYRSAVSMTLIPASRAASTMAVASSWVVFPIRPKFIAPSARVLT